MITTLVGTCVVGLLAGVSSDELLRGQDPRSRRVLVAGILGAIAGLAIRRGMSDDGWLVEVLAALFGALVAAFAMRIRISSVRARGASV